MTWFWKMTLSFICEPYLQIDREFILFCKHGNAKHFTMHKGR